MATSSTRKKPATEQAPAKSEPVKEDAAAAADAPAAPDAPEAEQAPEAPAEPESSDAPRKEPAAGQLDAPEPPAAHEVAPTNIIKDNSGQLSVDMLTKGPAEIRSELYDAATKKAPNPDEVFDLEFPNGQAVICRIRLCENLWVSGDTAPMSRLVMAAGQRTDRAYANQIIAILREQVGQIVVVDEPAQD